MPFFVQNNVEKLVFLHINLYLYRWQTATIRIMEKENTNFGKIHHANLNWSLLTES